jgi:hypothetical protein
MPVRCYKIIKLFIAVVQHSIIFSLFLVFLIFMSTCFDLSDKHLAILQKLNLGYMQCNYVVWDHMMLTVVWARAFSFTRFLDHTQACTTVGRTPVDE